MADSKKIPLVTVVIPMFNAYPFIGEMLECMEKQTYANWELIIVDDGSTDESIDTVEKYAKKDNRISLIKRPESRKKGGNTCRNIGLENANGEYIIWFDADDLIAHYCLEQRVSFIENNPNIDIAIAPLIGFRLSPYDKIKFCTGLYPRRGIIRKFMANTLYFVVVTNIYRVNSLRTKSITWDEDLKSHQDADMNLECIYNNLRFASIIDAKADYFWRIVENSNSVSKKIYTKSHLETNIYYFNKQVERFGSNKRDNKHLYLLVNYILKILIFQPEVSFVKKFVSQPYFKKHKWLAIRLKVIDKFQHIFNFKTHIPTNLLTFLLCPFFEINYRLEIANAKRFQRRFANKLISNREKSLDHCTIDA